MNNQNYYEKPKNKIFFDIETIPANEKTKEVAIALAEQKMNKYNSETKSKSKDELYRQTSISGDFGQVFCVGYALNDQQVKVLRGEEKEMLTQWWQVANEADLFIGHNIMDFDLRFLFKRSIVHRVKPTAKHLNLSFARYRNFPIFDTMREWEKWSASFISLDTLAKALGLESSKTEGIDGSKVYDHYLEGKHEEIYKYCARDVELTRKIYKRMAFED